MSDTHITESHGDHVHGPDCQHGADAHHGPSDKTYLYVFGALLVCTAVSFGAYKALGSKGGFLIILLISIVKAALVGAFFMHLVADWRKLYILIVPALILGPMLVIVLWPDSVLGWQMLFAAMGP